MMERSQKMLNEWLKTFRPFLLPVLVAVVAVSLMKLDLFVTYADMEREFRMLETKNTAQFATKQDIQEIKQLLASLNISFRRIEEHLFLRGSLKPFSVYPPDSQEEVMYRESHPKYSTQP
jgi:hypothetical protein